MQLSLTGSDIAVPVEDVATDLTIRDVIGKKTDTTAGTSLVSLVKIADAAIDAGFTAGAKEGSLAALATSAEITALDGVIDAGFVAGAKEATLAVPAQNAVTNTNERDVIGNKTDTVAGDSLVSLVKIADAAIDAGFTDGAKEATLAVPAQNAATNVNERDVIGNKTDTTAGDSLVSLVKIADAAIDAIDALEDVPAQNAATNTNQRDVIGNKTDTTAGDSIVSLIKIADAAIDAGFTAGATSAEITALDGVVDAGFVAGAKAAANDSSDTTGSYDYTDAGGEQTVVELDNATRKAIYGVWLDLTTITLDGTIKIYYKVDGTNYRLVDSVVFSVATDSDGVYLDTLFGITEDFKVTYTESADEGAVRAIPYSVVYRVIE